VTEGDKVQAIFTNNLKETTSVHFHGVAFEDFFQDGVPFVTQKPIAPGETYTYEFTATPHGSLMYHSHHNASDQAGRGLLAAFIVDPKDPAESYAKKYGVTHEYTWISNDTVGGFRITLTRWASTPANATTSSSTWIGQGFGRSTATSSRTSRGPRGCSGWSAP